VATPCLCSVVRHPAAVAAGSAYYHLAPDDVRSPGIDSRWPSCSWSSLPSSSASGWARGWPLGPLSPWVAGGVVYWQWLGDLRPYLVVQFFPLLACRFCSHGQEAAGHPALGLRRAVSSGQAGRSRRPCGVRLTAQLVSGHTMKHLLRPWPRISYAGCSSTVRRLRSELLEEVGDRAGGETRDVVWAILHRAPDHRVTASQPSTPRRRRFDGMGGGAAVVVTGAGLERSPAREGNRVVGRACVIQPRR